MQPNRVVNAIRPIATDFHGLEVWNRVSIFGPARKVSASDETSSDEAEREL
jgi:hypothetical protein